MAPFQQTLRNVAARITKGSGDSSFHNTPPEGQRCISTLTVRAIQKHWLPHDLIATRSKAASGEHLLVPQFGQRAVQPASQLRQVSCRHRRKEMVFSVKEHRIGSQV